MKGWNNYSLGEIADIRGGKRVPKGYRFETNPTDYPYITVSDFTEDGTVNLSNLHYVSNQVRGQIARYTISSSEMYLSIAGTIGKTGFVPEALDGALLTENACKLVFRQGFFPRFVYYFTKTSDFTIQAGQNTRIAAQPKLALERLKQINLNIPSLPEQRRIVAILDEAFAGLEVLRTNAEKNVQNARDLFDSYLNDVFTIKGDAWKSGTLSEFIDISHGFAFDGADFDVSSDTRKPIVLTPGNYDENGELYFTEKNTKRLSAQFSKTYLFREGDLTVVMTDLSSKMKILGKPAFIDRQNVLHNQRIGRVAFLNKSVIPRFMYYFLRTKVVSDQIKMTSTGTMVRHTAPKRILANIISYPATLEEQAATVAAIDDLSTNIGQLESLYRQKLAAIAELKQSILQKAFSGQLTSAESVAA